MVLRLTAEQAEALGVPKTTIRAAQLTPPHDQPAKTDRERSNDGRALIRAAIVAKWPGRVIADETIRYARGYLFCDFVFPDEKVGVTLNGAGERLAPVEACAEGAPDWHVIPLNCVEMTKASRRKLAIRTIAKALRDHTILLDVDHIG